MPLKQLYMSIYDINPTESFWDKVDDRPLYKEDAKLWLKEELIDDIRKNGLKYQLNVDPYGNIKNGNMRYWCARYLLEQEHDTRFLYLPVQRNYAAGAFYEEFLFVLDKEKNLFIATDVHGKFQIQIEVDKKFLKKVLQKLRQGKPDRYDKLVDDIGEEMMKAIHRHWVNQIRDLTIPSQKEFAVFEIDPIDEFRMKNFWDQQRNIWSLLFQPHPKLQQCMIGFGLPGKSEKVTIMEEGSEEEKKAYKEWWKKIRKERKITGSTTSLKNPDYRKKIHGKS